MRELSMKYEDPESEIYRRYEAAARTLEQGSPSSASVAQAGSSRQHAGSQDEPDAVAVLESLEVLRRQAHRLISLKQNRLQAYKFLRPY